MLGRLRSLAGALLLRRLSRSLDGVRAELAQQNALLARLTDHFCPLPPPLERDLVRADTGVTHLDPIEMGLSLDYIEKTRADTGHVPDEEEILVYLADEKTRDLQTRLAAREDELVRLAVTRRERT